LDDARHVCIGGVYHMMYRSYPQLSCRLNILKFLFVYIEFARIFESCIKPFITY